MSRAPTTTDTFNAVGDQTRRAVLEQLAMRECTVGELVERLSLPQPQISKHLRVLREVNLVQYRSVGRARMYRINRAGLEPLHTWLADLVAQVNKTYDRLDDYLHELQTANAPQDQEE